MSSDTPQQDIPLEEGSKPNTDAAQYEQQSAQPASSPDQRQMGPTVSKLGFMPTQANVSMFTGAKEVSTPPIRSPSAEEPTHDRVFPVRSVVSVDPTATPMPRAGVEGGFPGFSLPSSSARPQPFRRESARSRSPASVYGRRRSPSRQSSESRQGTEQPASPEAIPPGPGRPRSYSTGMDPSSLNAMMSGENASIKSEGEPSTDGGMSLRSQRTSLHSATGERGLLTARFKHIMTDGGHAVITGRDGETLQRCEDEPIHMPGAIQSFGLLIAFKEEAGKLVVRVVSENSRDIIGYSPEQLFMLDNFLDILTDEQADNLLDHLDFIRDEDAADPAVNGPEVFMLSIRSPRRRTQKLWCAMHIIPSDKELIICEFELEDDPVNPLVSPGQETPEPPEDTLSSEPTAEELAESTVNMSKPLRVLRSARRKRGETAAMEVFNIMSQVQEQLASAQNLDIFLKVLIGVVKELTGFHRVMIYQFDAAWNGRVVAELLDPRATKDLYKGLNFPASDIPKQARELYKVNKVRLLYDRDQITARLVCRTVEDLEKPLDMTYAYLRAMSPIHIKYLANMAVRASMSISINAFDELWGLVSCHAYGSKGTRVSFPIRKMCRLIGDTASRNIERLSYASRLQARKLINTMPTSTNPSGYIVASSEDLLKLFEADIGALSIRDETKILGNRTGHVQEILAMLEFLRMKKITTVFTSQDVSEDFPDLRYPPGFNFIAGLLYVPLSSQGEDFIVFFRRGQSREVKWAGNPYEKFVKEGTEGYLEPRKSFKQWSETIIGKCRDWKEQEVETAAVLCLVYGKFIEVWRQKEQALQSSQLTRLLLANSAHEVRTPLNAIINYLEIALEGSLDSETRENLSRSHSASKSLIYVINDLLDLTKTEEGQELMKEESFDLPELLREATGFFQGDARRKNLEYSVGSFDHLPTLAVGDQRKVRQVISNLIANAIQNTASGSVKVDAWVSEALPMEGRRFDVEIAIEDTGAGMSTSKVDALFRELEQVTFDGNDGPVLQGDPLSKKAIDEGGRTLGLGLAVVARALRIMNGQLRLKTEEGRGSRFLVILGLDYPESADIGRTLSAAPSSEKTATPDSSVASSKPDAGEVLLIHRTTSRQQLAGSRRQSAESVHTLHSTRSQTSMRSKASMNSQKSDVDRLIEAIQEPISKSDTDLSRSQHRPARRHTGDRPSSSSMDKASSRPTSSSGATDRKSFGSLATRIRAPGEETVMDSRTPIKPVRVHEGDEGTTSPRERHESKAVSFGRITETPTVEEPLTAENLSILVAEDDPINSKIIKKRLEKLGHTVQLTVNGEECATQHGENPDKYDVVLMDLQVCTIVLLIQYLLTATFVDADSRWLHGHKNDTFFRKGRSWPTAVETCAIKQAHSNFCSLGISRRERACKVRGNRV